MSEIRNLEEFNPDPEWGNVGSIPTGYTETVIFS